MEKMISVINENLNSVVSGIKDHKSSTEELLATIKTEMDKKVDIAQEYKINVEDAKSRIARSENEIKDLERDLEDLNEKFDGKDFKEILSAGNKEINSKIIEKRKAISVQSKRIIGITDKAHELKEELVELKNRRSAAEDDLNKTKTLLNYYETNINNMIDFTTNHIDELDGYSVPSEDDVEYEKIDINKIADGKIFEEIAEISVNEPDAKLVEKALNDEEAFQEEFAELIEEDNTNSDSVTGTLDNIISAGKDIISSGKYVGMYDFEEETTEEPEEVEVETEEETTEEVEEAGSIEDIELTVEEPIIEEATAEEFEFTPEVEVEAFEPIIEEVEETIEEETETNEEINFDDFLISFDDVNEELNLDGTFESGEIEEDEEEIEEGIEIEPIEEETSDEDAMEDYLNDDSLESGFTIPGYEDEYEDQYEDSYPEINEIEEDLGSSNKEIVTNLLLKTGVSEDEINKYVKDFKEIDVDRLKREIETDRDRELAEVLASTMPLKDDIIQQELDLDDTENKVLKKAAGRKYIVMNAFPEIVKENYETIVRLGIKDPKGVFINHPGRFTMNPSRFNEILDRYDTDDLIRCLNKNGAVIDKL